MRHRLTDLALRISLIYGLVAVVWILLSDWVVTIVAAPSVVGRLQTYKGWAFVAVTTMLLYATLHRELRRQEQEIRRREQADSKLYQRERQLSTLFELVPVGIAILDAGRNFLYTNPALSKILDLPAGDLRRSGLSQLRLVNAAGEPLHADEFAGAQAARENQMIHNVETGIVRDDHSEIWLSVSAVPVDFPDWRVIVIASDITERRRAEQALEAERALLARRVAERTADLSLANAELARAARLKDEFMASMSHELRTPLNAILGHSEALQEAIYGPVNAEQVAALEGIARSGQHLLALINDILDLAKIEAGQLSLELASLDVDMLCTMALHMITQAAMTRRLRLTANLDSQVRQVAGDERRLKQILVNLLSNAVKFTPEGGQVGLEVRGNRERQTVTFTVWDTGIGIAAEDLPRLFQPFVQLDSSLNRQYTGTGLGLSLVARLTHAHGGQVTVESTPGQGSRFSVTLPWQTEPEAARALAPAGADPARLAASAPGRQPAGGARVLLAEDTEANLTIVTDYLRAQGYTVIAARTGREALARAREAPPAVILMDIQMPDMDGLEAIRQIQADPALHAIPIIALTALAMPGDRERCLAAGATVYLAKPFSLRSLAEQIDQLLAPPARPDDR